MCYYVAALQFCARIKGGSSGDCQRALLEYRRPGKARYERVATYDRPFTNGAIVTPKGGRRG
jgi:hypothetical protein